MLRSIGLQGMLVGGAVLLAAGFSGGWMANGWRLTADHQTYVAEQSELYRKQSEDLLAANQRNRAQESAIREANRKISDELQPKLDAATADRDRNRRLLRAAYEAAAARAELPEASDQRSTAAASGAPSTDEIDAVIADVIAESTRNAERLDALIRQIEPQL